MSGFDRDLYPSTFRAALIAVRIAAFDDEGAVEAAIRVSRAALASRGDETKNGGTRYAYLRLRGDKGYAFELAEHYEQEGAHPTLIAYLRDEILPLIREEMARFDRPSTPSTPIVDTRATLPAKRSWLQKQRDDEEKFRGG